MAFFRQIGIDEPGMPVINGLNVLFIAAPFHLQINGSKHGTSAAYDSLIHEIAVPGLAVFGAYDLPGRFHLVGDPLLGFRCEHASKETHGENHFRQQMILPEADVVKPGTLQIADRSLAPFHGDKSKNQPCGLCAVSGLLKKPSGDGQVQNRPLQDSPSPVLYPHKTIIRGGRIFPYD